MSGTPSLLLPGDGNAHSVHDCPATVRVKGGKIFDEDDHSLTFSESTGDAGSTGRVADQITYDSAQNLQLPTTSSINKLYSASTKGNLAHHNICSSANTPIMSNKRERSQSPPHCIAGDFEQFQAGSTSNRTSIFGRQALKKYNVKRQEARPNKRHPRQAQCAVESESPLIMESVIPSPGSRTPLHDDIESSPVTPIDDESCLPIQVVGYQSKASALSPLTPGHDEPPRGWRRLAAKAAQMTIRFDDEDCEKTPSSEVDSHPVSSSRRIEHHHKHAMLLCLAFFCVWTSQNLLSPNLSLIAEDFGYDDPLDRDRLFGSNLALVGLVLSLPLSACIGFATDVVRSRRLLISATVLAGGLSTLWTGLATTYNELLICRFIQCAAMSGSVPCVFSLMSDWYSENERNAASSVFQAAMGAGILIGQCYSGFTTNLGWRHPFLVSGFATVVSSFLVLAFVTDPVRGGREGALNDMLSEGVEYNKRPTWKTCLASVQSNASNRLLILQGLFSSIPYGAMFVFFNDVLSSNKGLTVQDATFVVAVFGIGSAVGGIMGGVLGTIATRLGRHILPIFMSLSTILGLIPFLALLNDDSYDSASWKPCSFAFVGGFFSSLPAVNVRPCIINVNTPELRGVQLTVANIVINLARGVGPWVLTDVMIDALGQNRVTGFELLLLMFWSAAAVVLAMLAKTLPTDQKKVEAILSSYALENTPLKAADSHTVDSSGEVSGEGSFVDESRSWYSIDSSLGAIRFVGSALKEIRNVLSCHSCFDQPEDKDGYLPVNPVDL
mmetsp:Transcript_16359/g.37421  ORF Transcript_16359/g.37421 Transcript_16359/m.37421 type:complete len:782 (+) Transcript_16359:438-2783(+)